MASHCGAGGQPAAFCVDCQLALELLEKEGANRIQRAVRNRVTLRRQAAKARQHASETRAAVCIQCAARRRAVWRMLIEKGIRESRAREEEESAKEQAA
jgi:hypothetical protein